MVNGKYLDFPLAANPMDRAQYPTSILGTSLFVPAGGKLSLGERNSQRTRTVEFKYRGGEVTVVGPPLTTTHEDAFITILQILDQYRRPRSERSDLLEAYSKLTSADRRHQLSFFDDLDSIPANYQAVVEIEDIPESDIDMDIKLWGKLSLYAIGKKLQREFSGQARALLLSLITDLKNTTLTFKRPGMQEIHGRFLHVFGTETLQPNFRIEIKGIMLSMVQEFSVIDFELRNKLSPNGKVIHRYLCSCGFPKAGEPVILSQLELQNLLNNKTTFGRQISRLIQLHSSLKPGPLETLKARGFISDFEVDPKLKTLKILR
jgi:hypothetical protein